MNRQVRKPAKVAKPAISTALAILGASRGGAAMTRHRCANPGRVLYHGSVAYSFSTCSLRVQLRHWVVSEQAKLVLGSRVRQGPPG